MVHFFLGMFNVIHLDLRDSIYASKIVSYAQGYVLMGQAAQVRPIIHQP